MYSFCFFLGWGESHIVENQQKQALSFLVKEESTRVEYRQAGWEVAVEKPLCFLSQHAQSENHQLSCSVASNPVESNVCKKPTLNKNLCHRDKEIKNKTKKKKQEQTQWVLKPERLGLDCSRPGQMWVYVCAALIQGSKQDYPPTYRVSCLLLACLDCLVVRC